MKQDTISKIINWVLYILMGISVVFGALYYVNGVETTVLGVNTSSFMRWAYIMLAIAIVVALVSPIYGLIVDPKGLWKMVGAIAIFVVVGLISYFASGNSFTERQLQDLNITATTSHYVGAGMLFTYVALAGAIFAVLFSSIYKYFNK
ncbi:MAG: hypothetical protein LBM67_08780 [Lentimicrobiaceae bacterium]|jgi:hypothetical protein|nr:hypothetical protein [Lentimicrobiaceae bacterium]